MVLATSANPPPPPYFTATDQDFQASVLERSMSVPVLVDFWAPWCGPCKVIGPVLEKLATEWGERFVLAKVNMDENPMLAQALAIRSIPAVKLFVDGQIKDEFIGAYPEPEVRKFLEANLPTFEDNDAVKGLQMMNQGRPDQAAKAFAAVLEKEPDNAVALVGMGHLMVEQGDLAKAQELLRRVKEIDLDRLPDARNLNRELASLQGKLFLMESHQEGQAKPPTPGADPDADLLAQFYAACGLALQGKVKDALEGFLAIVKKNRKFKEDGGRKGMLAVFALLPPDSPLTDEYRNRLSSILFS